MRSSHAGFQLVDEEFNALVEDLVGALDKFNVPKKEKDELLGRARPAGEGDRQSAAAPRRPRTTRRWPSRRRRRPPSCDRAGKADAADLLEVAVKARVRGQRSYAEQLYSAAERLAPAGALTALDPLFRAGAPERITTALKTMPKDTPAQPKDAVGGSDEDEEKPKNGSLAGTMKVEGASGPGSRGRHRAGAGAAASGRSARRSSASIEQRDRQFAPRMLAVSAGSTVSFPNFDPIFHNVFSTSHARSFDLGIYKNGESRDVTFAEGRAHRHRLQPAREHVGAPGRRRGAALRGHRRPAAASSSAACRPASTS